MKTLVHGKFAGSMLVLSGIVCWLAATALLPKTWAWSFPVAAAIAGCACFFAGCFLPEYRSKRAFVGRRSALQVMGFYFWLSISSTATIDAVRDMQEYGKWLSSSIWLASLVVPFASYILATYLIRGFHAPVAYTDEADSKPAGASSQPISPGLSE